MQEPGEFLPRRGMPTHIRCLGIVPRGAAEMLFQVRAAGLRGVGGHFPSAISPPVSLSRMRVSEGLAGQLFERNLELGGPHICVFKEIVHFNGKYL